MMFNSKKNINNNNDLHKISSFEKHEDLEKMFNHSFDDMDMFCE
jgi:hypothetical protein